MTLQWPQEVRGEAVMTAVTPWECWVGSPPGDGLVGVGGSWRLEGEDKEKGLGS